MYGHEGVSRALKQRLEERLPRHLNAIRLHRDATLRALPDPVKVYPHFVPDIDVDGYPAICVTEYDTPTGITGAREVRQGVRYDSYVYNYPFRIWIYVRSTDYGITELMLKRYITAVRTCLLEDRIIADNDDAYVTLDPETLSENFDQPAEDTLRQVFGAGFIGVVLESTEIINVSTVDPRADLPLSVDGKVIVRDRFTGEPTGQATTIPTEAPE